MELLFFCVGGDVAGFEQCQLFGFAVDFCDEVIDCARMSLSDHVGVISVLFVVEVVEVYLGGSQGSAVARPFYFG